jgi:hypothetical protein
MTLQFLGHKGAIEQQGLVRVILAMAGKCGERIHYDTELEDETEAEATHADMPPFRCEVSDSCYTRRSQAVMDMRRERTGLLEAPVSDDRCFQ